MTATVDKYLIRIVAVASRHNMTALHARQVITIQAAQNHGSFIYPSMGLNSRCRIALKGQNLA